VIRIFIHFTVMKFTRKVFWNFMTGKRLKIPITGFENSKIAF